MVAGIFDGEIRELVRLSACVVWVAIAPVCVTLLLQQVEQGGRDAAGGLSAIFAHPDECGPAPRAKKGKNQETGQQKMASRREKVIEIRELFVVAVADSLDAIKRDATHGGQAGNPGSLHIDEGGLVCDGEALLLGNVGDS
jgi:hypothetical protein